MTSVGRALAVRVAAAVGHHPLIGLDFDGSLSEIAPTPDEASILPEARRALERLVPRQTVCILSGRDPGDVRERIGVPGIAAYAGSHGLDVTDGDGRPLDAAPGVEHLLPTLDAVEADLRRRFAADRRIVVERKRFGVAVHHRLAPEMARSVEDAVATLARTTPGVRAHPGKAVYEVRPIAGGKGAAIVSLAERLGPVSGIVYAGDDVTDEDAFTAIVPSGFGILVSRAPRRTAATATVRDPAALAEVLDALADLL